MRQTRHGTRLALAAALLVTLAACGSSDGGDKIATADSPAASPSGSPSSGGSKGPGDALADMLKYAQCMRGNGVPEFPDPVQDGGGLDLSLPAGSDPAAVRAAEAKCRDLMPMGGEDTPVNPEIAKRNRELAKCMRANGVPNFPDPAPNGGLQLQNDPAKGLDPKDPVFDAATKKCGAFGPDGGGSTNEKKP